MSMRMRSVWVQCSNPLHFNTVIFVAIKNNIERKSELNVRRATNYTHLHIMLVQHCCVSTGCRFCVPFRFDWRRISRNTFEILYLPFHVPNFRSLALKCVLYHLKIDWCWLPDHHPMAWCIINTVLLVELVCCHPSLLPACRRRRRVARSAAQPHSSKCWMLSSMHVKFNNSITMNRTKSVCH